MAQSPLGTRLPSFGGGFRAGRMEVKSRLSPEPLGTLGDSMWIAGPGWDTH